MWVPFRFPWIFEIGFAPVTEIAFRFAHPVSLIFSHIPALCNTLDKMATPCSVKAMGRYLFCSPFLKVPIWRLKPSHFSLVDSKRLSGIFLEAWLILHNPMIFPPVPSMGVCQAPLRIARWATTPGCPYKTTKKNIAILRTFSFGTA
jgi:hypothetical protein